MSHKSLSTRPSKLPRNLTVFLRWTIFPIPHKYFMESTTPPPTFHSTNDLVLLDTKIKNKRKKSEPNLLINTINSETTPHLHPFSSFQWLKIPFYQRTILPILLSFPRPLSITDFCPAISTSSFLMNLFHQHSNVFFYKKKKVFLDPLFLSSYHSLLSSCSWSTFSKGLLVILHFLCNHSF